MVPTLDEVMPTDRGYVHKQPMLLVPVAVLNDPAKPAFHASGAGKAEIRR